MRRVAIIAAVFGLALILAAGSRTAHAVPLTTATSNDSVDRVIVVQPGDNLSKLGVEYGSTAPRLFDANSKISNPNLIYPGEHLRVPGADEHLLAREIAAGSQAPAPSSSDDPPASVSQAAPTPQQSATTALAVSTTTTSVWTQLAECESSDDWTIDTGNGFYGGLQFTLESWQAVGGSGYPNETSEAEQIARAEKLQAIQGWGAWPACSAKLGL